MVKETFNAKETFEAGYEMGKKALPGQIYCLNGDLGVGKTVFTQGFAKGLGIEEPVNSPTLQLFRNTMKADCRCIILMCTELVMSKRWMSLDMRNISIQTGCALLNGALLYRR